jgi:hypothetical protein
MAGIAVLAVAGLVTWLTLAHPGTRPGPSKSSSNQRTVTYAETTGGVANTTNDYFQPADGVYGQLIDAARTVRISCRVQGYRVPDGNIWWYRIASPPWDNNFYTSADAFWNNGQTSGNFHGSALVDFKVPIC